MGLFDRGGNGLGGLQDLISGARKGLQQIRRGEPATTQEPSHHPEAPPAPPDPEISHAQYHAPVLDNGLPNPFATAPSSQPPKPTTVKDKAVLAAQADTDPYATSSNRPISNADGTLRPGMMAQHAAAPMPSPTAPKFVSGAGGNVLQRIKSEWAKVADPISGFSYFCQNYVWINNQKHGYMRFKLYGYQERLVGDIRDNRFVITRKFRQAGISLLTGVYCLWYTLTHPRMQAMVVSIGLRESSKYLEENCRAIYEALPPWMRGGLRQDAYIRDENDKEIALDPTKIDPIKYTRKKAPKDAATEMMFPNKSKIRSVPTGKAAGRGFTTKLLVIDEAAFIENIETFYTGAYPTINNSQGSVFIVSTVNGTSGIGGWYYNIYKGAVDKTNKYHLSEMHYTEHPDYNDPEWVEDTMAQLGDRGWRQEVLGEFLASGNTYIDADYISELETKCQPPMRQEMGGKLWIWSDPIAGHHYSIGADCATRGGLDNSTAQVIDTDTGEQVAEYKGKLAEGEFAKVLAELGYRYGTCQITPEMNAKAGGAVTISLKDVQKYKQIYTQPNGEPGWNTTSRTRDVLIADLETNVYGDNYTIRSTRTIDELKTFIVTKTGKIEHDASAHDDLLFAFMIATNADVVRKARKISHKAVQGVLVDSDIDQLTGDPTIGQVKPVYSSEEQKKQAKKKRQALLHDTPTGQAYLQMQEDLKTAGAPDDTLEWLLS